MTAVGVVWIAIMTAICVIGIELSARTQVGLLSAELVTLVLFSVVALVKVAAGTAGPHAVDPSLVVDQPVRRSSSFSAIVSGVLIAVFIYWGWDSTVTVNEESRDASEGPGKAALLATVILLAIYVIVSIAAQAYDGPQELIDNADDVLSVLGDAGVRLAAGQDPDHRRADLGGGLDADDDPADGAHVAVDGARRRDARAGSARSTRAT